MSKISYIYVKAKNNTFDIYRTVNHKRDIYICNAKSEGLAKIFVESLIDALECV